METGDIIFKQHLSEIYYIPKRTSTISSFWTIVSLGGGWYVHSIRQLYNGFPFYWENRKSSTVFVIQ